MQLHTTARPVVYSIPGMASHHTPSTLPTIPARAVLAALLVSAALTGCGSVSVGIGIPLGPNVSMGVGVGSGGVHGGVAAGSGPVGVGVGVNSQGQVMGSAGVGVSTGGAGASLGVGVGTSTVLHDPNPPGTIGPMPWWAHPAEAPAVDYWR